jgi:hypothetical protein
MDGFGSPVGNLWLPGSEISCGEKLPRWIENVGKVKWIWIIESGALKASLMRGDSEVGTWKID